VKVVVDAYDGTMKFYVVDKTDPMIQAWERAFPALFTAGDPPPALQAHFRYPEDLFNVQSEVYRTYHMTRASDFYAKEDAWSLPKNPAFNSALAAVSTAPFDLPPAYLLVGLPGETQDHFLLTRPFTPRGRDNMISFMTANSDPGPGEYGKLRVLQFPRQRVILGPIQVYTLLNQDPRISKTLSLLKQGGSDVIFGSLVTLPIKDSILYIQPLFVTGTNVPNPELKRVAVVYGTDTVMANTFGEALQTIFGGNQQPSAPGKPQRPSGNGKPPRGNAQLQQILAQANRVYSKAQAALSHGDFAAYGRLIKQLGRLLTRAQALSPSSGSSTPAKGSSASGGNRASSPAPAPSASSSP
jgi:uncharacterized membrane protein (UPF0182 family)